MLWHHISRIFTNYVILKNIAGALSLVIFLSGIFFLLFPDLIRCLSVFLNRWFSVRRLTRPLDTMKIIDDKIYKIARIIGFFSLLIALALAVLQFRLAGRLLLKYAVILLSFLTSIVGIFFLLPPHISKRSDPLLNKWFSLRRLLRPLEIHRYIEDAVFKNHRVVGGISFAVASILLHWFIRLRVWQKLFYHPCKNIVKMRNSWHNLTKGIIYF